MYQGRRTGMWMVFLTVMVAALVLATPRSVPALTMTQQDCRRCHGTDDKVITAFHHGVRDANNWTCSQCHKPVADGSGGYTIQVQRDCVICHGSGYHTEPAGTNRDRHHRLRNANDYGCLHCHPAVQDDAGNTTIVLSRDCFFCHTDGQKPWREVKWLTDLPAPTAPDTAATVTDITGPFHDTLMYGAYEIVTTAEFDKAISVRFDKDAATTSRVTLGFYVFEPVSPRATIRIYPYQSDGATVNTASSLDFKVTSTGWQQCDVTPLAKKMSGFTWMKFRVTVTEGPLFLSEGTFEMLRPTGTGTNLFPVAAAGPDQIAYVGDAVTFSGTLSHDPDGTIVSYEWDFGDGTVATGPVVTHAYSGGGAYLATLRVTDNLGAIGDDYAFVTVKTHSLPSNVAPVANAGPDLVAVAGQPVTLSAEASADADGQIASWSWHFDDGTSASGPVVTKVFSAPETRVATLTVVDNQGALATDTTVIIVTPATASNVTPVANAGADVVTAIGQPVTLSGAGSTDQDGTILTYSWDFGDGTTAAGISATKTYSAAGTYTVTLTVQDNAGATSTDTVTVTVTPPINKPPIAAAGADITAQVGETVSFSGSGSYDPDGTIVSYSWNFGDGTRKSGSNVTKSYAAAGTYTVTLAVTDNSGAKTTDTIVITVVPSSANVPPVANAGPDISGYTGQSVSFSGAGSSDSDGSIVSYVWNFSDGTTKTGMNVTKTFGTPGTWTATLTVTDSAGATATDSTVIKISYPRTRR